MKNNPLFTLFLLLLPVFSCKTATKPVADCDPGYLPCEDDITTCCEVVCPDLYHNCGGQLTDCCLDSTSHSFSWSIDTLGIYGSYLNDVAIVNENDIWVVGNIETDSTSYNAAHWDGSEWELIKVLSGYTANTGIQYFSENDIWVTSGFPIHWDGEEWTLYHLQNMGLNVSVEHLWGTSSSNIYFVGLNGSIVHYDGVDFVQMDSGTDVDLLDIAGTPDGEHVFAVGWDYSGESVALMKNGNSWEEIYYGDSYFIESTSIYGRVSAVEALADTAYFTTTAGLLKYIYPNGQNILTAENQDAFYDYHFVDISMNNTNDILLFSRVFSFLHFNGNTWYSDESISEVYSTWARGGDLKDNFAVVSGYCCGGGHAIVGRGYR